MRPLKTYYLQREDVEQYWLGEVESQAFDFKWKPLPFPELAKGRAARWGRMSTGS